MQAKSVRHDTSIGEGSDKTEFRREKAPEDIWGLGKEIQTKEYLHDPMDHAKELKLRSRVGDQYLPRRRDIAVIGWRKGYMHRITLLPRKRE